MKQVAIEIDGFRVDELDDYSQFAKPIFRTYRDHHGRKANPQSATVLCRKFQRNIEECRKQYSQEELIGAMEFFLGDEYWGDKKWPLLAFFKQTDKFVKQWRFVPDERKEEDTSTERALSRRKLALREKIQELRGRGCDILTLSALEDRIKGCDVSEEEIARIEDEVDK